ncbi:MAG: hypothetical protein E7402_04645 [Ruminococcaceae bacterium]|nr:hypothetical protein [Oscillospiraceae bacterium]
MRHYIPKNKNPDTMPHNLYMQMLYIIRDYAEGPSAGSTPGRRDQWRATEAVIGYLQRDYERRPDTYGNLVPLRAFFEYPYFSIMFMQQSRDMAASKRFWSRYRCRFARLLAMELGLL